MVDATSIYGLYATLTFSLLLIPTILLGIYWLANKDQPASQWLALSNVALLVGFVLAAFRNQLPDILGIFVFNILVILGLTLRLAGIRSMVATDQASVSKTPDIVLALLGVAVFSLAYTLDADFLTRVAVLSSWVAVIYVATAKVIWDHPNKSLPHWLLLACILAGTTLEAWRGLTYSLLAAGYTADTSSVDLVYMYHNPTAAVAVNFLSLFILVAAQLSEQKARSKQLNAEIQRLLDQGL